MRTGFSLAVVGVVALTACEDTTAPVPAGISVERITSSDTIMTVHPLTLVIGSTDGRPLQHALIEFTSIGRSYPDNPYYDEYPIGVMHDGSPPNLGFATHLYDSTDNSGRLTIAVQLGHRAGPGDLLVQVVDYGFEDTLHFTIQPGSPTGVRIAPTDTAVYVGAGFAVRAEAIDRFGNARPDSPVEISRSFGPITVSPLGAVSATGIGRGAVLAQGVGSPETAYVSVVPPGWVVSQQYDPGNGGPVGLFLEQLDGSGRQRIAAGVSNSFQQHGFDWSPDGQQLALVRDDSVTLLAPGGTESTLIKMSGPIVTSTRFSHDGQWVYFGLDVGTGTQAQGMYRIKTDGTGLEHVGVVGHDYMASPSHDGASVAYVSLRGTCSSNSCIRVLDLATGQDRLYGSQDYLAAGSVVAWSPNADLIAFASGSSIMTAKSDGTGLGVVAHDLPNVWWVNWSPDAKWLVVAISGGVMLINMQSLEQLPIGQLRFHSATAWRP